MRPALLETAEDKKDKKLYIGKKCMRGAVVSTKPAVNIEY